MQRIGEKLLGEVLRDYIQETGLGERMQALDICALWPLAAGQRVAEATRSLRYADGVLYCQMTSSTVRNMLFYNIEGGTERAESPCRWRTGKEDCAALIF